jgi:hypothetical protein
MWVECGLFARVQMTHAESLIKPSFLVFVDNVDYEKLKTKKLKLCCMHTTVWEVGRA